MQAWRQVSSRKAGRQEGSKKVEGLQKGTKAGGQHERRKAERKQKYFRASRLEGRKAG